MRKFGLLFAVLVASSFGSDVSAQRCGTVLTTSVTLGHDMNCAGYPYAFRVAAHGITINLNGKRIHSDGSNDAIIAHYANNLTIRGPGRVELFNDAIEAYRADYLHVTQVEFVNVLSSAVRLHNSRGATVQRNRFRGFMETGAIDIRQPLGLAGWYAGSHTLADNVFELVFAAINLCGADAGNNRIHGNTFGEIFETGIRTRDEAAGNTIYSNKFRGPGSGSIWLQTGRNLVYGNVFEGNVGSVSLSEPWGAECVTRTAVPVASANRLLSNKFYGTPYPFRIETDDNRIGNNLIQDAWNGIHFSGSSSRNDATGNSYPGTAVPVEDLGTGNSW